MTTQPSVASSSPARIMVVEDNFLARIALASVIGAEAGLLLVAEAESGEQAVEVYRQHRPDVVLMDVRLPGINGLEAIKLIRAFDSHARIIIVSNYEGSEDIYRGLQAGAVGYLLKDTQGDELVNAIRTVHKGKRYMPPSVGARLSERLPLSDLTPRELEVLREIVRGSSNKEIAATLNIADKTVRIHVSNILSKMGVHDRTQAAIAALQRGLVHLE